MGEPPQLYASVAGAPVGVGCAEGAHGVDQAVPLQLGGEDRNVFQRCSGVFGVVGLLSEPAVRQLAEPDQVADQLRALLNADAQAGGSGGGSETPAA
ncbi:hypothetical protein OHB07_00655 [Streptomyces sp. NBC_00111]|uniref:hypothetical protein n=1 Tax=unclassified Streptomyces TaxID=2593676 RepID=UPI002E31E656|nr:hypothetical protein [Streptomyces sp. NBC_01460]